MTSSIPQRRQTTSRFVKFISYYKPYLNILFIDLLCAAIVAATTLILPLCARHITQNILATNMPDAISQIYGVGALMLGLLVLLIACNTFVDYQGHMMGTLMERDIRRDLFAHYQKLPFHFFDEQKVGQLMSRLTNDLFAISELYHHAPEEFLIAILKAVGSFIILININFQLTLILFFTLPIMVVYGLYFNRRLNAALFRSKERIGDINAQVEDTLAGIRVVQSFTNEDIEQRKFGLINNQFVETRRDVYRSETFFYEGLLAYTQLLIIAIVVFGGAAIVNASLDLPDLVT